MTPEQLIPVIIQSTTHTNIALHEIAPIIRKAQDYEAEEISERECLRADLCHLIMMYHMQLQSVKKTIDKMGPVVTRLRELRPTPPTERRFLFTNGVLHEATLEEVAEDAGLSIPAYLEYEKEQERLADEDNN